MRTKGKRILKNGAIGAYVHKDGKWKWRIIGHTSKKGGDKDDNSIKRMLVGKIEKEKIKSINKIRKKSKKYQKLLQKYHTIRTNENKIKFLNGIKTKNNNLIKQKNKIISSLIEKLKDKEKKEKLKGEQDVFYKKLLSVLPPRPNDAYPGERRINYLRRKEKMENLLKN